MVMIEDYEHARWGQYLTATGGTRQVLRVHAAVHVSRVLFESMRSL